MKKLTVFREGDLVYSFADKQFYLVLEYEGLYFKVYCTDGSIKELLDVTVTHVEQLKSKPSEKGKKIYYY